jgi:hypothetical protein
VKRDTLCTSTLLAVERDTPCTALLPVKRNTLCTSILPDGEKGYTLHVYTAGGWWEELHPARLYCRWVVERDALCTYILLVEQGILAK